MTSSPISSAGTRAISISARPRSRRCSSSNMRAPALKLGLKLEGELGVNPYKFGMIGSTDAHTGLAAVEEDNYFGKTSAMEPERRAQQPGLRQGQGGNDLRVGDVGLGLCGGLGDREHPRGAVRRDGAPRDLRHDRPAHAGALLRRLRLRGRPMP